LEVNPTVRFFVVLVAEKFRWNPVFKVPPGVGIAGAGKSRLISDEFDEADTTQETIRALFLKTEWVH
jgi:hypothetical protein